VPIRAGPHPLVHGTRALGLRSSPPARSGRLTKFDRNCFDERPGSALSVRVAGPTRGSSLAGPNMRYEPLAHVRRHTAFGTPESERVLELRRAGIRRQPERASRSFPPARRGPTRPLPDGRSTAYTGI
jgi:hypothetical protein